MEITRKGFLLIALGTAIVFVFFSLHNIVGYLFAIATVLYGIYVYTAGTKYGQAIKNIGIVIGKTVILLIVLIGSCLFGFYLVMEILSAGSSLPIQLDVLSSPTKYPTASATPVPVQTTSQPASTPIRTPAVQKTALPQTLRAQTSPVTPVTTPASTEILYRSYQWTYKGTTWTYSAGFPKIAYDYYKGKVHNRENDYAEYALSDYDRALLQGIVKKFTDAGTEKRYSQYDNVMNVVGFVQSLPYTSDKVTTGYDEYPRYPLETLVDNGGDCEDTAILTAALINEMGYGVVLIRLPGHMAVGIKGSDTMSGTYFVYGGSRYYYLETTGSGWDLGHIPDEYKNSKATLFPMIQIPRMDMSCHSTFDSSDMFYVYYRGHCDIKNIGVGTATNPQINFAALAQSKGANQVWKPDSTVQLKDYSEGATGYAESTIRIPRNEETKFRYYLSGDNFASVELFTEQFST